MLIANSNTCCAPSSTGAVCRLHPEHTAVAIFVRNLWAVAGSRSIISLWRYNLFGYAHLSGRERLPPRVFPTAFRLFFTKRNCAVLRDEHCFILLTSL